MIGFEFEPQVSLDPSKYERKPIKFVGISSIFSWEIIDCFDIIYIVLPTNFPFVDRINNFLEVRNSIPVANIATALAEINIIIEELAQLLYQKLQVRFAFILPSLEYTIDMAKGYIRNTKHFNMSAAKESLNYFNQFEICRNKNLVSFKDDYTRIHLKLPYRFNNYSNIPELFEKLERDVKSILEYEGKPEIMGFINNWGKWKWVKKYY